MQSPGNHTMVEAGPTDPRQVIEHSPMTYRQFAVAAICILINAIDGFDILAISIASPGIAAQWGVGQASLGVLLSAELVGMGLGSIMLGQAADRLGRRPVLLGCLLVMTLGMLGAGLAPNFLALAALRLLTGVGIGGMLPCLSAIVAEVTNRRWRASAVALMAAGYPAGAVFGGSIATLLMASEGWRAVFHVGALFSAAMLPVAYIFLPEPLGHAMRRSTGIRRLTSVNRSLRMLGRTPVVDAPLPSDSDRPRITDLFGKGMAAATLLLTAAYFLHMISFYFFVKWVPKIVADLGNTALEAGAALVWANIGGLIGSVLFSALTWHFSSSRLVVGALIGSFIFIVLFGLAGTDIDLLFWAAAAAGLFANASIVGLYALIAQVYPERLRAGGAGFSLGLGRAGAALGPIGGGLLFAQNLNLISVTVILASGSLLAGFAAFKLIGISARTPG